jgi:hypothetical protein
MVCDHLPLCFEHIFTQVRDAFFFAFTRKPDIVHILKKIRVNTWTVPTAKETSQCDE